MVLLIIDLRPRSPPSVAARLRLVTASLFFNAHERNSEQGKREVRRVGAGEAPYPVVVSRAL